MDAEEIEGRKWVLIDIGQAVVSIQFAELTIRHTLHLVLPDKPPKTLKMFMRSGDALSKATLGHMAKTLRERVELQTGFDDLMTRFVDNRNTLMHHLNDIPGFEMGTADGREAGRRWLSALIEDTDSVVKIFSALHIAYAEAIGMDLDGMKPSLDLVGSDYEDIVESSFRWKAGS